MTLQPSHCARAKFLSFLVISSFQGNWGLGWYLEFENVSFAKGKKGHFLHRDYVSNDASDKNCHIIFLKYLQKWLWKETEVEETLLKL